MTHQISSGCKTKTHCYSVGTCVYIILKRLCISGTPMHHCLPVYTGVFYNYLVYTAGTSGSVKGQYATVAQDQKFGAFS